MTHTILPPTKSHNDKTGLVKLSWGDCGPLGTQVTPMTPHYVFIKAAITAIVLNTSVPVVIITIINNKLKNKPIQNIFTNQYSIRILKNEININNPVTTIFIM